MGSKMSVTAASPARTAPTRELESGATREPAGGSAASDGFTSAMSAAAQPAPAQEGSGQSGAPRSAVAATNSKASQASNASTAAASDTAAANTAQTSDAAASDASALSQYGQALDKAASKSRSGGTTASSTASAAVTLSMLLAAAGMQPSAAPPLAQGTGSAPATGDDGEDQNTIAQLAAAAVAAAGYAMGASAIAGSGGDAASTAICDSSATSASNHTDAVALIKFDALAPDGAGGSPSADGAAPLQTKTTDGDPSPAQPTSAIGPNGLPEMVRSMASAASQTSGAQRTIAIPVSDRNWSGAVAAQVQWQVNSNVQSATLQLSPEHLGPLEVRIDVQSSQVNVSFSANHADTRLALEQSVPRLREILANGGLTLGQTSVQQEARSGSQFAPPVSRVVRNASQNVEPVSISSTRGIGLIDEYA